MKVVRLVLPKFETARWEHLASKSLLSPPFLIFRLRLRFQSGAL
jgi:hypothetical protein